MKFVKKILLDKSHPGIQFFKYFLCGGFAFASDVVTFFLMGWFFFPALSDDDVLVRILKLSVEAPPEDMRMINFVICSAIAFFVSNLVAYVLNIVFVFKSGKHSFWKEFGLFYLVSGVSIGLGVAIGAVLIDVFGLGTTYSYVAKSISATLINYAARKFFIFHG